MHNPEKWMVKMAIGSEFLQEGNTFAKSVWLHLVEKVAQSLSSIITTLGTFYLHMFEFAILIILTYLFTSICRLRARTRTCLEQKEFLGIPTV